MAKRSIPVVASVLVLLVSQFVGPIPLHHVLATPAELGCWYTRADMPTARRAPAAVELDGKIYVIGGRNGDRYNVVERYDPLTHTWETVAPMPTERAWLVAAAVNGRIYAIGGSNPSGKLGVVEEYDPTENTWVTKNPMPTPRDDSVVGVVDGRIYVIGGWKSVALDVVEAYEPSTDTWTSKSPMPGPMAMASSAVVNGKIYVIGGLDGTGVQQVDSEYDPAMDTWSVRTDMPTARSRLAAGVVDGMIYVMGGYSNTLGWLDSVERYDPTLDQWETMNAMPTRRGGLAAATAGGLIYVFGGRDSFSGSVLSVAEAVDFACTNNPPDVPSDPNPGNWWTNRPLDTSLSWTGGDPDAGDTVTYDVYFGPSVTPPLVSSGQSADMYDPPELLDTGTWYYWRIVATDDHGAVTSGPRWRFRTTGLVTVSKAAAPTSLPEPGGTVEFTVRVDNNSVETVRLISLVDDVYGNLNDVGSCLVPQDIAVGDCYQCSFQAPVTGPVGDYTDRVTATARDDEGNTAEDSDDATVTVTDVEPTIEVSKVASPSTVQAGDTVYFTIQVHNDSVEEITLIGLDDNIFGNLAEECGLPVGIAVDDTFECVISRIISADQTNTITAAAEDDEGNTVTDVAEASVDVVPSIAVSKSADPTSLLEPGGTVEFTVRVDNNSLETVTLTSLVDDVYGNLNGEGSCSVPQDIAVGDCYQCSFQAPVTGPVDDYTDRVTATAQDDEGNTAEDSDDATVTVTDVEPTIGVSKVASVSTVQAGDTVYFTIRVDNYSVEEITLIGLDDNIFGNLTEECGLPVGIAVGDSFECVISRIISGDHTDTITAAAEDGEGNIVTDIAEASVDVVPSITVTKTADPTSLPEPGGTVEFTVRVDNNSSETVTLTSLVDDVYGNLNGEGSCSLPQDIAVGDCYQCSFQDQVTGPVDDYTDRVTATARDDEGNTAEDSGDATVTVTDVEPTIGVSMVASPSTVQAGDTVYFTIRVDNYSVEEITLIGLDDNIFGNLTEECGLPVGIAVDDTFECVISRIISADHTNTITAAAEDDEGNTVTDAADSGVDVIGPAIRVTKKASDTTANVGEIITYTYTVENVGDVTLTDVKASDDQLGAISLGSSTLAPGEVTTGTAAYVIDVGDVPGPHSNTVTVAGTPPAGPEVNDTDTAAVQTRSIIKMYLPIVLNNTFLLP